MVVYNDGVNTCGIAPPWRSHTFWMIREGSSVDAPDIALRSAYHAPWLGTTHPMSPATFRPGAVSCCRRRLCYLGLPMLTDESLLWYSYATASLLVAVFSALRFSRIPAAQALCADVDNLLPSMVYLHGRRSFEAARNDAALASVPSCRSTHICRLSPSTYCRAALVPLAVSFLHVFSCGQAAQLWHS